MEKIDYFKIIHKYVPPESFVYRVYIPHVSLVTAKALRIAKKLGLSHEQAIFIEEAAMLHDIGIVRVKRYSPSSDGDLPYLCHASVGREILEHEESENHSYRTETDDDDKCIGEHRYYAILCHELLPFLLHLLTEENRIEIGWFGAELYRRH